MVYITEYEARARAFGEIQRGGRAGEYEPLFGIGAVKRLYATPVASDKAAFDAVMMNSGLSGRAKARLAEMRRIVRDDNGAAQMVPRYPGLTHEPISAYSAYREPVVPHNEERTYTLAAIFNSVDVAKKLGMSPQGLQVLLRASVCKPDRAAELATIYVRSAGFKRVRVIAGNYSVSRVSLLKHVEYALRDIPRTTLMFSSYVIGDNLYFVYADPKNLKKPLWTLVVPHTCCRAGLAFFHYCVHVTPQFAMGVFALEVVKCGFRVIGEDGKEMSPQLKGYSAIGGLEILRAYTPPPSSPKETEYIQHAKRNVLPIYSEGKVVGSAIRVADTTCVFNEHTRDAVWAAQQEFEIAGDVVHSPVAVGIDMCATRAAYGQASWLLREVTPGEKVALVYSTGDAVEVTEPLRVRTVTSTTVYVSSSTRIRHGCSGAALISLADGALLGLFSTKTGDKLLCVPFTAHHMQNAVGLVSEPGGVDTQAPGMRTYARMKKKGFLGALVKLASTLVVDGDEPGGAALVSFMSGDMSYKIGANAASARDNIDAIEVRSCEPGPVVSVRLPEVGERVFLLVVDDQGDKHMSGSVAVRACDPLTGLLDMEYVGDHSSADRGCLVVAESDCAVVGLYSHDGPEAGVTLSRGWALVTRAEVAATIDVLRDELVSLAAVPDDLTQLVEFGVSAVANALYAKAFGAGPPLTLDACVDLWHSSAVTASGVVSTGLVSSIGDHVSPVDVASAYMGLLKIRANDHFSVVVDLVASANHVGVGAADRVSGEYDDWSRGLVLRGLSRELDDLQAAVAYHYSPAASDVSDTISAVTA